MKKLIICFFIILIMPVCVKADEIPLAESARSAILLEADTGKVLFEKNADEKLPPASMTKLMSMLIIIEAIDHGVIKWNQNVTVSENASKMGGSQILLETGEKMTVRDLFKGVAIASGNDAVVALSEAVAGNENNFINMMNKRAKQLGLKNTNFKNPHGLDTADHYSSSRDMALIAKELVKHKDVLKYTSIYETYLRENTDRKIWLVNTNKLVRFKDGVDGLKTGFTRGAGYCMTATAKHDGMRIIAVVMGQKTSKIRNKEISEMLDYAFAQYKSIDLLKNKKIGLYKVENGKSKYAEVIPKDKAVVVEKKSEKLKNIDYDIKVDTLRAPLKTGDIVGKMYIKMNNKVIKTINLTVSNDIHKANFVNLFMGNVKDMIMGNMKLD